MYAIVLCMMLVCWTEGFKLVQGIFTPTHLIEAISTIPC